MDLSLSLFVLLLASDLQISHGQNLSFSPQSMNFVASEGSTRVNFTCSTTGSDVNTIVILVEGNEPTDEQRQMKGIEVMIFNTTTRLLSIETKASNNNTKLSCLAVFPGSTVITVPDPPVNFQIQGLLSPPSDLLVESISLNLQRLLWTPPFSLDITLEDPDIIGYRVCAYYMKPAVCKNANSPYFDFLNLNLPLTFEVSAINVVGESNVTSISRPACNQTLSPGVTLGSDQVQVIVAADPFSSMHSLSVRLQQPPEIKCYDAYRVDVKIADSESMVLSTTPLLPMLVDPSVQTLQLDVMHAGLLQTNTLFALNITAVNINGENTLNDRVIFSTYDVQAVTLTPQTSGGLEVSCTFMDGSVASGCEITLCRMGQADDTVCMNITLQRDSPSTLVEISGNYSITQVVEVESDGQRVTVDLQYNQGSLVALVTASVRVTTAATTISSVGVGSLSTAATSPVVGIIVGCVVVGVLAIVLVALVIGIILVCVWKMKTRRGKMEINGSWSDRQVTGAVQNQLEVASWTGSLTHDEGTQGGVVMVTKVDLMDSEPAEKVQIHRPTSPFYTDVMHESPPLETSPPPPYLPPKKGSKHNSVISNLSEPSTVILPPPELEGPLANLSQEDVHEISFTSPSHGRSKEWLGGPPNTQISQESLISHGSQFSTSGANLTYVEIEHHQKTRKPKTTPKDKSNVLYSEIKVEEIPPVLPQKKSLKGPRSNASSTMSIDTDLAHSGLGFRV